MPVVPTRCCMPSGHCARSTECPASWRWRHRWRADSGRATAARYGSTASGNGCAWRARCSRRAECWRDREMADLAVRFCGIELEHPVINGSGTLDVLQSGPLGCAAFVTKTVTLHPREGNPPPRIAETPAGMVNSIGLANPGLDRF